MEIRKNHIKVGDYIVQYNDAERREERGFVVLDKNGSQFGYAHDHLTDALEQVLKYED